MKENKVLMEIFWDKHRYMLGWGKKGIITPPHEKRHWNEIRDRREKCLSSNDPDFVFNNAPYFDRQYFLEIWWERLNLEQRKKYLIKTWVFKTTPYLYGLDWWLPYFEDVGFITDCGASQPTKPIKLYRGIEELFVLGMSWTDNLDIAKHYMKGYKIFTDVDKKLYETVINPEYILAIIKDVNKEGLEYVVNYKGIKSIKEVE